MSRLPIPADVAAAPASAQPLLNAVNAQLGVVPNMFRLLANSPQTLEGFLGLSGALGKGGLTVATRNRIALAVAEANGCDYCLSAHSYLGKHLAKLDDAEMTANRSGASNDPKADAAVRFAVKLVRERGHVGEADVSAVKAAGYSDSQVLEILAHVALNTFTNYLQRGAEDRHRLPGRPSAQGCLSRYWVRPARLTKARSATLPCGRGSCASGRPGAPEHSARSASTPLVPPRPRLAQGQSP